MAEMAGNSNAITRRYLDSLLIETRYMNSTFPDTEMTLYGKKFKTPVMTAALSHLDHFMFEGATAQYAEGAAKAGADLLDHQNSTVEGASVNELNVALAFFI